MTTETAEVRAEKASIRDQVANLDRVISEGVRTRNDEVVAIGGERSVVLAGGITASQSEYSFTLALPDRRFLVFSAREGTPNLNLKEASGTRKVPCENPASTARDVHYVTFADETTAAVSVDYSGDTLASFTEGTQVIPLLDNLTPNIQQGIVLFDTETNRLIFVLAKTETLRTGASGARYDITTPSHVAARGPEPAFAYPGTEWTNPESVYELIKGFRIVTSVTQRTGLPEED